MVDAPVVEDKDGVVRAQLVPNPHQIRVVRASADSGLSGVQAEFRPGSFAYETEVSLQQGYFPVASPAVLKELGFGEDVFLNAVAPPVMITWTYDENTVVPYRVVVPDIVDPVVPDDSLVVFYKINLPDTTEFNVGILPPGALTRSEGTVSFDAKSYGLFQAAYVSKAVAEAKEVASTEPLTAAEPVKKDQPPASFTVVADSITGKELYPAEVNLRWNPAAGAVSFSIKLDNDDATCKSPEKEIKDLKVLATTLPALNGQNYVCVFANNAAGSTPASNNDKLSFKADANVPEPIKTLTAEVDGINVLIEWQEATGDFLYYEVQVGTEEGGAQQFNGPIANKTELTFAGFEQAGTVYYARIRTVDDAGNRSAWKAIGPIKQN